MPERRDYEEFYKEHQGKVDNFEAAFDTFIKKVIPEKVLAKTKEIAFDVLDGVTSESPVATGRLRANWNVGIGSADLNVEEYPEDLSEEEAKRIAMERGANVLSKVKPYEKIVISNNCVYAGSIERGHSEKAPKGMLGVTLDGIRPKIERGDYFD